jgi:hypothetical protein
MKREYRVRLFENRVFLDIFGHKKGEVTGNGEDYIMRSFVICNTHQMLFG